MDEVLQLCGVTKEAGHRLLLAGVDRSLRRGEAVGLTGANGSGKTTLLRVIAGLSRPSSGRIRLFGEEPCARARRRLGVLLDASFLYGDLTAEENLLYYGRLYGVPDPRGKAAAWLQKVGLRRDARAPVRTFSKGMRQRLAIARTLLHDPELLLLDEPFDGLDARHAARLEEWLDEWTGARTVLLVGHDRAQLNRFCARTVRIAAGVLAPEARA